MPSYSLDRRLNKLPQNPAAKYRLFSSPDGEPRPRRVRGGQRLRDAVTSMLPPDDDSTDAVCALICRLAEVHFFLYRVS